MSRRLVVKDTTFRDGVQGEQVEASDLKEALRAIRAIDGLGVAYHEVGFASASQAARERIKAAMELGLTGKVAAFGRTHPNDVQVILDLQVPVGVLVGKSRANDVFKVIRRQKLEDNLELIRRSISTLVESGIEAIYDAEHFFQAFFEDDREYVLLTLEAALATGACWLVLCDTNGKMTPEKIALAIREVKKKIPVERLGIHTHNDRGRAVANAEAAWQAGVCLIEGTIGGVGERTGNLNLCTIVPNLVLDYDALGISHEQLALLTSTNVLVCDVLNQPPRAHDPWVGASAFYTEAGMHESGLQRDCGNYWHADPASVGNHARVGVTDQSGKANLISKAKEFSIKIPDDQVGRIAAAHQALVDAGGDFGLAEASFYLWLLRQLKKLPHFFDFVSFRAIIEKQGSDPATTEASLRLKIGDEPQLHNADGDGPVNALDEVLRRTLRKRFPELLHVKLDDYKVRIVDAGRGTAAKVRVRIDFTDGQKTWSTMAVHENIIEASWEALLDGYTYKLVVNGHTA